MTMMLSMVCSIAMSQQYVCMGVGSLEVMVHRRLLADDARGVEEPLNETTSITPYPNPQRIGEGIVTRGRHVLLLSRAGAGMRDLRMRMDQEFMPATSFFGVRGGEEAAAKVAAVKPVLGAELPENVHLLTLQQWQHDSVLVRLAHQFSVDEDAQLSSPAAVDVAALLAPLQPVSMTEMSVTANQERAAMLAKKIRWSSSNNAKLDGQVAALQSRATTGSMVVELQPMEVRTFIVRYF